MKKIVIINYKYLMLMMMRIMEKVVEITPFYKRKQVYPRKEGKATS